MRPRTLDAYSIIVPSALAVTVGFFALPVVGIFVNGSIVDGLRTPGAMMALWISLKASVISLAFLLVLGTPVAYGLARHEFPAKSVLLAFLELPLVLPPSVAGIALFEAFGRRGLLGPVLGLLGLDIPFTFAAVVVAMTFVAGPLYIRQAVAAFTMVDPTLLAASRTLGASRLRTLYRIGLPVARPSLAAGAALAWARALGEFGATVMFAGSLPGETQTAPVAVYSLFGSTNLHGAVSLSAVLVAIAAGSLLGIRMAIARSGAGVGQLGGWG